MTFAYLSSYFGGILTLVGVWCCIGGWCAE